MTPLNQSVERDGMFLGIRVVDLVAIGLILVCFSLVAHWRRHNPRQGIWLRPDSTSHLGAEYDTIALAIRKGRGFSDPFCEPSGPTAWMPPVLVYWTAGIYWISGDSRESVVMAILSIKMLVLATTGVLIVSQARELSVPIFGYCVLCASFSVEFYYLFQFTHDVWLVLLVLNITWFGLVRLQGPPAERRHQVAWGVFGGFSALCSPVAGFTWAVATTTRWLPKLSIRSFKSPKCWLAEATPLALTATVSILMVSPWMLRNRMVMGRWIPIKSNLVYEVWQSQVLDDDGVLDVTSLGQHPWQSSGPQRQRYLAVGELQFIDERWGAVVESIRTRPTSLLEKIINRWGAACLLYRDLAPEWEAGRWLTGIKRFLFPLPLRALLLLVLLRRPLRAPGLRAAISIYVLMLVPYIFVSYYDRYAAPLISVKAIIVLHAFAALKKNRARGE